MPSMENLRTKILNLPLLSQNYLADVLAWIAY
jgi:hypothetical protein